MQTHRTFIESVIASSCDLFAFIKQIFRSQDQGRGTRIATLVAGIVIAFGVFGAQSADAAIPKVINYQSRLRNSGLSAITASTTIQFTIYNDLSAGTYTDPATAGGPLLWKEVHDGGACAKAQPDADGYFSVQLGACTAFPSYIDWNQPLYLGVQIESDPEASPRVLLAAFQYALNSDAVDTFSAS